MLFVIEQVSAWLGMSQTAIVAAVHRQEIDALVCDGRDKKIYFFDSESLLAAVWELAPTNALWLEAYLDQHNVTN